MQTPVRLIGSTSFLYMRKNDVYILAVTRSNANALQTFYFMNSVSVPIPLLVREAAHHTKYSRDCLTTKVHFLCSRW